MWIEYSINGKNGVVNSSNVAMFCITENGIYIFGTGGGITIPCDDEIDKIVIFDAMKNAILGESIEFDPVDYIRPLKRIITPKEKASFQEYMSRLDERSKQLEESRALLNEGAKQ